LKDLIVFLKENVSDLETWLGSPET